MPHLTTGHHVVRPSLVFRIKEIFLKTRSLSSMSHLFTTVTQLLDSLDATLPDTPGILPLHVFKVHIQAQKSE